MAKKRYENIGVVNVKKVKSRVSHLRSMRKIPALKIVDDGEDVIFGLELDNGVWKGMKTSEMAVDHDGRKILQWIIRKDFDEDAQEIIADQLQSIY